MTDESPLSQRAQAREAAQKHRAKGRERREVLFELVISGFSHQEIAEALGTSALTVRRIVDTAITERRLDAPDRYVRLQVARLTKALRHADFRIEKGDMRAFAPYLKILAAMDRYHNLGWRLPNPEAVDALPPPPLCREPATPTIPEDAAIDGAQGEGQD